MAFKIIKGPATKKRTFFAASLSKLGNSLNSVEHIFLVLRLRDDARPLQLLTDLHRVAKLILLKKSTLYIK